MGFRFEGTLGEAAVATLLLLFFSYAFSWIQALVGMSVGSVEAANSAGFLWMFPLTFVSSAFVDTSSMPDWLQTIADANPFTIVTNACRALYNGKPVGDDLREGKPTMLLVLARERAEPSDLRLLARVGSADLDDDDVAALRSHFERCGARAAVEETIAELTAEALHHLDQTDIPIAVKSALRSLGHYVGRRDH